MKYAIRTILAVSVLATGIALSQDADNEQPDHMAALIEMQYDTMSDCEKTRGDAGAKPEPCEDWPE